MIPKLQHIFHSIIKSLEVLYVIEGAKPCARILVNEAELKKVFDFLKQNKLDYSISDFKVLKQNTQSDFYSDRSVKIDKSDPREGYFFVYISKNKELAEKARIAEENNNHLELGLILGYPKCCCEFFAGNFSEKNTDLTLKALANSEGFEFPFYNNIAARHFDVSLLNHFPHSFGCEQSMEIAKNNLKIIQKHSRQLAEMFSGILRSAVIYTEDEGIFLLRKCEKVDGEIIYRDVLGTAKSKLYFLVNSGNRLKIIGKNSSLIGGAKLEGEKFGAIFFY